MSNLSKLSIALYLAIVGCYFLAAVNSGHIGHLIYGQGLNLSLVGSNEMDSSIVKVSDYIEKDSQGREFITPENMDKIQVSQDIKRENMIRALNEESRGNESVSLSNQFIMLMSVFLIFLIFFDDKNLKLKFILLSVLLMINLFVIQYSIINLVFIAALLMLFAKEFGYWFLPK